MTIKLGDASVRYDDARWQASASGNIVRFEPHGEQMRRMDGVTLRVVETDAACETLAACSFPTELYDVGELGHAPYRLGGVEGVRLTTGRTRCRNATPLGVSACVRVAGRAYVMEAVQVGCHGRNLFSGTDPTEELARGLSFAPDRD